MLSQVSEKPNSFLSEGDSYYDLTDCYKNIFFISANVFLEHLEPFKMKIVMVKINRGDCKRIASNPF